MWRLRLLHPWHHSHSDLEYALNVHARLPISIDLRQMWREVILPASQMFSAPCLRGSYFVSVCVCVCTVVLSVRRIVVEVHVDAVVNMAMTQPSFSRLQCVSVQENHAVCMSACRRTEYSRN